MPEVLEVFKASGVALRGFENEARKICRYLQKGYNIRINEIVFDFLKDDQGKIWFISCQGFKLDSTSLVKSPVLSKSFST